MEVKVIHFISQNLMLVLFFRQCLRQIGTVSALESVAHYSAWVDVGNPVNSTELLEILADKSWNQCIKDCKMRPGCDFVNYHQHTHLCYILRIIDINVGIHIDQVPGYMYAEKAEFDMVGYEDCQNCTSGEACDTSVDPAACHVVSCGPPVVSDDFVVLGNMYKPDSSVLLRCSDASYSQVTTALTCTQGGNWTETNISCGQAVQTTTPTSTPVQTTISASTFGCHIFTNAYTTITLTDGSTLTYKFADSLFSPMLPQAQARTTCGVEGGNLMHVTTAARMEFIQALALCPGFSGNDIWVDGEYDSNTNVWLTWDGSTIPSSDGFWAPGAPDYLYTEFCVRLDHRYSYYLNNLNCENSLLYICERVLGFG